MKRILSQIEQEVKCANEWCGEDIYRDGLCFDHFVEEETAQWDNWEDYRQMALEPLGYLFGDPVGEVLA